MIAYLLVSSLLIPANAWAAITPHLHSDLSMRVLHGLSTMVLLPLLLALWNDRRELRLLPALVLAVFTIVMVLVNSWITAMGIGGAVRLARPSAAGAGTDQRAAVLSAGTSAHRR